MRKWPSLLLLAACATGQVSSPPDASLPVDAASSVDARSIDGAVVVDARSIDGAVVVDARPIDAAVVVDARPIDAAMVIDARPIDAAVVIDAAPGSPCNLDGYTLVQTDSAATLTLASPPIVASGSTLVVGRCVTEADFLTYWGVSKPTGAGYVMANTVALCNSSIPMINGAETFQLQTPTGVGTESTYTVAVTATVGGGDLVRATLGDPAVEATWTRGPRAVATPGPTPFSTAISGATVPVIVEVADADNYYYEFVEILCP